MFDDAALEVELRPTPVVLTSTSCMMSGLGKSQTPPFETAEMSTP